MADHLDKEFLERQLRRIEIRIRRYQSRAWNPEDPYIARKRTEILPSLLEARRRLREGSYGICLVCDGPIPLDRLEQIPGALHCLECAERKQAPVRR